MTLGPFWIFPSLFLVLAGNIFGSVSAAPLVVTDTASFVDAIESATDPTDPIAIQVDADATIDFDDASSAVGNQGLDLSNKYFEAVCVGGDDVNKCTLKRASGNGRFFLGKGPFDFSFEGFEFDGGSAPNGGNFGARGGAFALSSNSESRSAATATFEDCNFINNRAREYGGALVFDTYSGSGTSSLSFRGCQFDSNYVYGTGATGGGGSICVQTFGGTIDLDISDSSFRNGEDEHGNANDIFGNIYDGQVDFSCTDTTTSGTSKDVNGNNGNIGRCLAPPTPAPWTTSTPSSSHAPSSIPSMSSAPSTSTVPSSAPSTTPSSAPSTAPSGVPTHLWQEITYDDFENGWGNFEKTPGSGANAMKVEKENNPDDAQFIPNGEAALRIRDDKGAYSAVSLKSQDVSMYSKLRVSFWYRPRGMETDELFALDYSSDGGTNWKVMKRFVSGKHFENGSVYKEIVDFDSRNREYELTSQAMIRFRCKASYRKDFIYIDEVLFEGFP